MKRYFAIAAAALQLIALAYMAGEREWVVRAGHTVFLRTAPVDPRDVMRGDYVQLNYEISRVSSARLQGGLTNNDGSGKSMRDMKVYAHLQETGDGLAELIALSDRPPAKGLFIRGRLDSQWGQPQVRYGIEAFFMEQGKALELEQSTSASGIQVPLEMEVAIGRNGLAVLKGYRRPTLGVGLELENATRFSGNQGRQGIVAVKVRLMNASSTNVAIVDLPGGRSLTLVDAALGEREWVWLPPTQSLPGPKPRDVIVLKPGSSHTIRVPFSDAHWSVERQAASGDQAEKRLLAELDRDFSARFRFEYRPPPPEKCRGLPNEALIWHGRLSTRAFTPAGSVD